jgi:hypothetical protein
MADPDPTPGDVFAAGLDVWRKALRVERQRARGDERTVEDEAAKLADPEGNAPNPA